MLKNQMLIAIAMTLLLIPVMGYGHDTDSHSHSPGGGDHSKFSDSNHDGVNTVRMYHLHYHGNLSRSTTHLEGEEISGHSLYGGTHGSIATSPFYPTHSHTLGTHEHDDPPPPPPPPPPEPPKPPGPENTERKEEQTPVGTVRNPVVTTGGGTPVGTTPTPTTDTTNGGGQPQGATTTNDKKTPVEPVAPLLAKVWVTEYMMLDSGRRLPHWIEVYNPNSVAVDIGGYTFSYATRKFANSEWKYHPQTLESFEIPAQDAIILVSHDITIKRFGDSFGGIEKAHIYQLNLNQYVLKRGWLLQDAQGNDIHRIGQAFENEQHPSLGNPVVPRSAAKGARQSWNRYKSADAPETSYYGASSDVGTPGFFEYAPAAPALIRPKRFGIWAHLKK